MGSPTKEIRTGSLADSTKPPPAPTEHGTKKSTSLEKWTSSGDRLFREAEKRRQRMEETKRRYESQTQCTFKPKINKPTRRQKPDSPESTKGNENRFNALYEAAGKRRQKLEDKQKTQEKLDRERASQKKVSPGSKTRSSASTTVGQNRLNMLYQSGVEKAEKLKELSAASGLSADCTFSPKINRKSRSPPTRETTNDTITNDVGTRLYQQGKKLLEKREEKKKQFEVTYSFKPKLNENRAATSSATLCPTKEEINELHLQREVEKMQLELKDCTFTPNAARGSASPRVLVKPGPENVHRRLFTDAKDAKERKERIRLEFETREREIQQQRMERLRAKTRSVHPGSQADGPVFDRLYEQGLAWITKKLEDEFTALSRREIEEWEHNESECTFQPEVHCLEDTALGDQLIEKGPVFDRLYSQALARIEKREWEEVERYGLDMDCTFAPQINPKSREIVVNREARMSQSLSSGGDNRSLDFKDSMESSSDGFQSDYHEPPSAQPSSDEPLQLFNSGVQQRDKDKILMKDSARDEQVGGIQSENVCQETSFTNIASESCTPGQEEVKE